MTWATPLWALLGVAALVLQAVAMTRGDTNAKLSRHIERLRVSAVARVPLIATWSWLTWHWFIEPRFIPQWRSEGNWWPDIIVVVVAALAAWFTRSTVQKNAPWPWMVRGKGVA